MKNLAVALVLKDKLRDKCKQDGGSNSSTVLCSFCTGAVAFLGKMPDLNLFHLLIVDKIILKAAPADEGL